MTSIPPHSIPTMFQQRSTAPPLQRQDHYRFTTTLFNSTSNEQIRLQAKLSRLFKFILPHLPRESIQQLQLTCRALDTIVRDYVWRRPSFHKDPTYDALVKFQRFLAHLPYMRQVTRQTIQELTLTPMDESLYERVPKDFFMTLIKYTTGLVSLNMARATFFSAASLPATSNYWRWNHLTSLNLSHVEHMSDPLLVQLAVSLPNLCLIRLDGTQVNHGVSQLAHHCDRLGSLSLKQTPLTDEALMALAKFRTIHVTELDISECRKISATGLDLVARYCVHLSWLGLAHTPISLATLRTLDHRFWKYLDIAYCDRLHQDITTTTSQQQQQQKHQQYHDDILAPSTTTSKPSKSLYELIIGAPQLQHLSLSITVLQYLLSAHRHHSQQTNRLVDIDDDMNSPHFLSPSSSRVDRLVIHNLPEHTPFSLLDDLMALFPMLKHLKLVRDYYQTDHLHLSFSPGDNQAYDSRKTEENFITEDTIKSYRPSSSLVSIVMEKRRDLLEGPSMW